MPPRKKLPRFKKRGSFNIRHILHDYGHSGLEDAAVLRKAQHEKRVLITIDGDFKKARRIEKSLAVVKIIGGLTIKDIDDTLCKLVSLYSKKGDYFGKIARVNKKGVEVFFEDGTSKKVKFPR